MDQLNRPRTRGLEASEAEEDAKLIRAALKEPSKYIKKAHLKLRHEYGGDNRDDSDDDEKFFYQQPPFDDDENEVKPGVKRKRGGGRRGYARRKPKTTAQDGTEEDVKKHTMSAKLAALLKEESKPHITPYNGSTIEYKQVWYKLGDIVSIQKDETKYFAQILGFHTDQFCERYATIQWLLPRYKINLNDPLQPPITVESFRGGVPADEPVSMNCFRFILRPPAHYFQSDYPSTVTRGKFYMYNNNKCFFDSPTITLTSVERRY